MSDRSAKSAPASEAITDLPKLQSRVAEVLGTAQGNFTFTSQEVPFGVSKTFLGGKALAAQTADAETVDRLTRRLTDWVKAETELRLS